MKRSSRVRIGATATAAALSLALITGCGGESKDNGSDSSSGDKDSSSTTAAKALSAAELGKLIIAKGDLDGFDVQSADTGGKFAESKDKVKVVDAKCAPLAYVLTGFAPGADESAYVNRMATEKSTEPTPTGTSDEDLDATMDNLQDILDSTMSIVSLSSYDGEGAQETLKSVSDAVSGCASGFSVSAPGEDTQKFTKVVAEKASGTGDESIAFAVSGPVEGDMTTVHGEVVRHGSTVAAYYSLSLAAMAGEKVTYDIPAELIKAQAAKLK
ncbi:hypothetical protein [Streptomyces sp. NPDC088794]|jgi:hypothetical protein|uniref:hypothetical protein n=1 Tax=Streptomyces sp. NPDC088794 TaxID=3365902 RepID=UPI0038300C22